MSETVDELIWRRQDGVVVACKPAGLASTGRDLDDPDCLQAHLMRALGRRKLWAVHQLDKRASGLNLFVERKALVAEWVARLKPPGAEKLYLAVVRGAWHGAPERSVTEPIGTRRRPDGRTEPAVTADGKPSRSDVRLIASAAEASLVEVRLWTGRTHQIRLHLAHLGHPVIGDAMHGEAEGDGPILLHAWRLRIPDAPEGLRELQAPVPPHLRDALRIHGLPDPA